MQLTYYGSGGFDSLELETVPLPAGLSLMLAGLSAFGIAARRTKKAAQTA